MNYLKTSTANILKERFQNARSAMQRLGLGQREFLAYVTEQQPEYDCPDGWKRLQTVWYAQTSDVRLTELAVSFVESKKAVA